MIGLMCPVLQRRRDRINEKMRALQELVPHCNKVCGNNLLHTTMFLSNLTPVLTELLILIIVQTDKASILDEAIEYLKSLQMQVQV